MYFMSIRPQKKRQKEHDEMISKIKPGDSVLLMADKTQGVALQPFAYAEVFWNEIQKVKNEDGNK